MRARWLLFLLLGTLFVVPLGAQEIGLVPVATGPAVAWTGGPLVWTGVDFTPQAVALIRHLPSGPIPQVIDLSTGSVSDFIRPAPVLKGGSAIPRWGRDGRRYLSYRDEGEFRILQGDAQGERITEVKVGVLVMDFDVDGTGNVYVIGPGTRKDDSAGKLVHASRGATRLWSAGAPESFGLPTGSFRDLGPQVWYHVWVQGGRVYAVVKDQWAVFSPEGEVLARGRFLLSSPHHGVQAVDFIPGIGWLVVEEVFPGGPGVFARSEPRLLLYDDQGRRVMELKVPEASAILRLRDGRALLRLPDHRWQVVQVQPRSSLTSFLTPGT